MPVNQIVIDGRKNVQAPISSQSTDIISLRESYTLENATRGISQSHIVNLNGTDVVELIFDDGSVWLCNSDTLADVFPEAAAQGRSVDSAFVIPQVLKSNQDDRSVLGNILLKAINVFAKKEVDHTIATLAAKLEKKQLDEQSGLYSLSKDFKLELYQAKETVSTTLLFLHGTASSTLGSFGNLANTDVWSNMCLTYKNNILAFQHESLTKSPLENVLLLVKQLPANIELHLVSHSRGGLIGDILARFATADESNFGFDENEKAYLKKTNRTEDLRFIAEITETLKNKKITISKFVRVACPAAGTILASNRLDNFFNILFNLIGYGTGASANPAYSLFKDLIAEVLNSKNDINVLPGLEAMNPQSPFIKILNNPQSKVITTNRVFVVAGNSNTRFNLKALLILASKLFYQEDNDLVVNTRSMYLGPRRYDDGLYYFDNTTETDHFHYFTNNATRSAINKALAALDNEIPTGFKPIILNQQGELQRNALLNLEGGQLFTNKVTGNRPILVLLPGIMGSNLTYDDGLLWINYLKFLTGGLTKLDTQNDGHIKAPSLIKTSYQKFVDYFSSKYDVVTFPFDWRLQLNDSAKLFENKIKELLAYDQPIKIVGHSMGGVLVRDFIVTCNDTWQKLNKTPGFRLIFLGAPLGGSFRIPAVLFGQDAIIKKLSKIDIFHTPEELITVFAKFSGILNLLPLTKSANYDFSDASVWRKMAGVTSAQEWPVPAAADLALFAAYRDQNVSSAADIDYSNMVYIAGQDKATPCDYEITAAGELVFLNTAEGDASVTWESGIPQKIIVNNSVYYVNVTHGSLANEPSIFKGIEELLDKGTTNLLSKNRPEVRSAQKLFRMPVIDDFDISPLGLQNTLLGLSDNSESEAAQKPIKAFVSNGHLSYANYPLLAGHFNKDGILQAERIIDKMLGGALSNRHRLSIYPGEIGSSEFIESSNSGNQGAIIVGLGDYGSLTEFQLTKTVEQAIARYLLNLSNSSAGIGLKGKSLTGVGISSLIIGCDYGGLSVESSVRAIIQGVRNANNKLVNLLYSNALVVETIEFVELYQDKAMSCFYSLKKIAAEQSKDNNIILVKKEVKKLFGANSRIVENNSSSWWTRITVCEEAVMEHQQTAMVNYLEFSLSTGGAREETQQLSTNKLIIYKFVEEISINQKWTPELSTTLFELIIPNSFKNQLKKQNNINWILDKQTAWLPWELLHDKSNDVKPICINSGMIRQLKTDAAREKINAVIQDTALVIADPNLNGFVTQLAGARKEGEMVSVILDNEDFTTTKLIYESPFNIIQSLFNNDYKIIHLSGHGAFNEKNPQNSGMLIGDNVFLSTREICQMSTVPEFVFVNCCHLGKVDGVAEELYKNRYKLAANIGTQLIENGVKAVIVAGWQVDDAAALLFAEKFYAAMFANEIFGEAVRKARRTVYDQYKEQNNTWGAYQCYGDPFYKFRNTNDDDKVVSLSISIAEEAEIQLSNLKNELETSKYTADEYLERLHAISKAVEVADVRNALITEYEALIYAELGDYETALFIFDKLLKIEKAEFAVSSLEKYLNIKAKHLAYTFIADNTKRTSLLKEINGVITSLKNLLIFGETAERYAILGSTYKRKALLSTGKNKTIAYKAAAQNYREAYKLNRDQYSAYAVNNWLEIVSMLIIAGEAKWGGPLGAENLPTSNSAKKILKDKLSEARNAYADMDFWNEISYAGVNLCLLIVDGDIDFKIDKWDKLHDMFKDVWMKGGSKAKKIAELEHIEILLDGLGISPNAPNLTAELEKMKKALKGVVI
jgi:CHAT domain-containing protein